MSAIADFPLFWRWSSSSHAAFSASELAALFPYSPDEAARIHDEARPFVGPADLEPAHFAHVISHPADLPIAEGRAWLCSRVPELAERVTLSWDQHTALHTTWELFTTRWADFCYPSSDDLVVLPESRCWVLLYHHAEVFHLGRRAA